MRFKVSRILLLMVGFLSLVSTVLGTEECKSAECFAADAPYVTVSAETIAAYNPPIERVLPSDSILYRIPYRQVLTAVDIYDAPGGNIIDQRPQGEYFVSVRQWVDGWAEINEGQWITADKLGPAPISKLGGVLLNGDLEYPVGWVVDFVAASDTPGAEPDVNDVVAKYEQVFVFSTALVNGEAWVQIGVDRWLPDAMVGYVVPVARPEGIDPEVTRWVGIDLDQQVIIAYEGETPVYASLVATGLEETPTLTGIYEVYVRFFNRLMSRGNPHEPFHYYMEDVPYTMYFNGDQALHGAYWHDRFGRIRSHGCVNMPLTSASWIFNFLSGEIDFGNADDKYPMVYVYHSL